MGIEEIMEFIGAYEEDRSYIILVREAVVEELKGLIPGFNLKEISARQKLIMLTFIQHFYDNKELFENNKTYMKTSINSMLIKEIFRSKP
ncbi:hypothetical protein N2W44_002672 [Clostridium perfringens]|nr:hypothetical protein [Clostridium perfringens]EJT6532491.1 hypothetical protein [Clostridium perfringens]MDK0810521.1 hypothetical protein [Clostridium perfringens]MDK0894096.1 hypothetical protein [Clostridium perfringens]MDU3333031.1 hypothetical protein [Clostridium perfringens]